MELPRVCTDVRGAPRDHGRIAAACLPAMGVIAVEAHNTACLRGFSNVSSDGDSAYLPALRPGGSPVLNAAHSFGQARPCRHRRSEAVAPPEVQSPGGKTVRMEDTVVTNRTYPVHNVGARAPWRKNRQRLTSARCCDCNLRFLFPQGSRHLPFPFSNARVEVGRTVMEG